jgi:hypothetical protein
MTAWGASEVRGWLGGGDRCLGGGGDSVFEGGGDRCLRGGKG